MQFIITVVEEYDNTLIHFVFRNFETMLLFILYTVVSVLLFLIIYAKEIYTVDITTMGFATIVYITI